jgi:hypothetical protein
MAAAQALRPHQGHDVLKLVTAVIGGRGQRLEHRPGHWPHRIQCLATSPSRTFESLSCSSNDTQATVWPLRSAHCTSSVVFP